MTLDELQLPELPDRDPAGHKGTFGTVGVIGGRTGEAARERIVVGTNPEV